MQLKDQFSEFGHKYKLRVMDFVQNAGRGLYYDKKMTTALLCIEYAKAFQTNAVTPELQARVHNLITEAFQGFLPYLDRDLKPFLIISDNINHIINKTDLRYNLLKAYEVICLQLTGLRSLSNPASLDNQQTRIGDLQFNFTRMFDVPLDDIDSAWKTITKVCLEGTGLTVLKNILPVYSPSATIGFNTILFCIFHDFYPIGIGENPFAVHDNKFEYKYMHLLQHDFTHNDKVWQLRRYSPQTFNQYRKVYFKLFESIQRQASDENSFKKNILILFYLVYDIACYPEMTPLAENPITADFFRHDQGNQYTQTFEERIRNRISNDPWILICDFIVPLRDAGYMINASQPEEDLRTAMLDAFQEFSKNHPQLFPPVLEERTFNRGVIKSLLEFIQGNKARGMEMTADISAAEKMIMLLKNIAIDDFLPGEITSFHKKKLFKIISGDETAFALLKKRGIFPKASEEPAERACTPDSDEMPYPFDC